LSLFSDTTQENPLTDYDHTIATAARVLAFLILTAGFAYWRRTRKPAAPPTTPSEGDRT
jgi:hypothetical protein